MKKIILISVVLSIIFMACNSTSDMKILGLWKCYDVTFTLDSVGNEQVADTTYLNQLFTESSNEGKCYQLNFKNDYKIIIQGCDTIINGEWKYEEGYLNIDNRILYKIRSLGSDTLKLYVENQVPNIDHRETINCIMDFEFYRIE